MKPNTNTDQIIRFANNNGYVGGDHALRVFIDQYVQQRVTEAVYGFHEHVMGKEIIKKENDQAFNYARLHKEIDFYVAELQASLNTEGGE